PTDRATSLGLALAGSEIEVFGSLGSAFSVSKVLDYPGQNRDHDNRDDHELEILLNHLTPAEPPARQQERQNPGDSAGHIKQREPRVVHLADPGDERREGPNDGNEPGQDDRLASVLLVEPLGVEQVLSIQQARSFARE